MSKYPTTGLQNTDLEAISWLTGDWRGEKDDARFEEYWSAPAGNAMMGMFRWIQGEQVRFYEFMTIEQEAGAVVLRIKHFNPGLKGWEEKEESVPFTLVQLDGEQAVFIKQDSPDVVWMVYRLTAGGTLIAGFESEGERSKPAEEPFVFERRNRKDK